jgi:Flp pilus assembly secretin CpaC
MRRTLSLAAAVAVLAFSGVATAQSLPVRVDQAARVSVSSAIRDVVVGNPAVADVTVIDGNSVLVTGKTFGITNLLIIDQRGRTVLNREIVVSAADDGRVTIYRGGQASTFACAPTCERTSGDATQATADPGTQ